MIMTITLTLIFLIALNFILLFTSCNKTPKENVLKNPQIIKNHKQMATTKQLVANQLAPTGS